jgi:hypothetical protein
MTSEQHKRCSEVPRPALCPCVLSVADRRSSLPALQTWDVRPYALRELANTSELVEIKVNDRVRFPIKLVWFGTRSDAQRCCKRMAGLLTIEQVPLMMSEHAEKVASESIRAGHETESLALASCIC